MPHLSRYSDQSEKEPDIDHAHISLMNIGADICIPGGNDTNKMHLNILFYELDQMLREMREENKQLKEDVKKLKEGGARQGGGGEGGDLKEVMRQVEDKLKQTENRIIGKFNLETQQTKKDIEDLTDSLNKINSKVAIMDLRIKKDSKDNKNDLEKIEKKVMDKLDEERVETNTLIDDQKISDETGQITHLEPTNNESNDGYNNIEVERKFKKFEDGMRSCQSIHQKSIEKLLNQMEKRVLDKLDEDREETKSAVQALFINTDIDNVNSNIQQLSSQIRDIKLSSMSSQSLASPSSDASSLSVMFDAIRSKHYKGENDNDFLSFDQTSINLGDGFDVSLGKFTAPVSGIYLFTLNVYGAPRDAVILSIRVKEGSLGNVQGVGKGSQSVLVALNQKDTVRVYVEEKTKLMDSDQEHFTHFIGILLRPL